MAIYVFTSRWKANALLVNRGHIFQLEQGKVSFKYGTLSIVVVYEQ